MPPPPLPPNTLFNDRYVVNGRPRRGGSADVYHARHRKLDREVALKVGDERLIREARLVERLTNEPNVVRIHEVGSAVDDNGDRFAFAAFEWMERGSALDRIAGLPDHDPDRLRIALQIALGAARGLAAAHAARILHLDVTPANILVDQNDVAKLADFGVAFDLLESPRQSTIHPGTHGYAPPEQTRGGPVDERTDVYSLGATLHHLLAGSPPAAPGADPRRILPSIPRRCAELVRKAIASNPADRHRTARELIDDLQAALDERNDHVGRAYLAWLQRVHGTIQLPVTGRSVPLDRVYTALRVVPTSLEERRRTWERLARVIESGQLRIAADARGLDDAEAVALLVEFPRLLTLEYRDRADPLDPAAGRSLTLGDAYRRLRSALVILGDPGSGKTTVARWLVRAAAESLAADSPVFRVRTCDVDPAAPDDESPFELGPARWPVFVRAAEFARRRAEIAPRNLELLDFLAETPFAGYDDRVPYLDDAPPELRRRPVPPEKLAERIRAAVEDRSALVVVDGLDEISSDQERINVRNSVQEFIREFATPDPRRLGNLVILTSRIVGYQLNALDERRIEHVLVERMDEPAVRRFLRLWIEAVDDDPARARARADQLADAIHQPKARHSRELAANPLLAGVLAAVFLRDGRLPETRVALFEAAIQVFLNVWKDRARHIARPDTPTGDRLVRLLEPLAEHIHAERATGLVREDELRAILARILLEEKGLDPAAVDIPPEIRRDLDNLVELIREPVGILVARYERVYGFIHLAFQEYLAARRLLRADNLQALAAKFRDRLESPRWREPALMAIGRFAADHPDHFVKLAELLVDRDGQYAEILPRAALLLVAALPELPRCPDELAQLLIDRLLRALNKSNVSPIFAPLRELVENALPEIRDANPAAAERAILQAIANPELAPAAAAILLRHEWYDRRFGDALLRNRRHDSPAWKWPLHAALREMATPPPPPTAPFAPAAAREIKEAENAIAEARTEQQRQALQDRVDRIRNERADEIRKYETALAEYERNLDEYRKSRQFTPSVDLPPDLLPFRRALERHPEWLGRILEDPAWATLVVGLYGGLGDYRAFLRMGEYRRFSNFLQLSDGQRRGFLAFLKEHWGEEDPVYDIAVHLDTIGSRWKRGSEVQPRLQPAFLADESPLTERLVLPALRENRPASDLLPELARLAVSGTDDERPDAALALVLLGASHLLPNPARVLLADDKVRERLELAFHALRDPVVRMADHFAPGMRALAQSTSAENWSDVLSAALAVLVENSPARIDTYELCRIAPAEAVPRVLAEHLVNSFLGGNDDAVYQAAVALDTLAQYKSFEVTLIRSIALAPLARHRRRAASNFRWNFERVPPRHFDDDDIPVFVMTAIENIDRRISMARSWAIGQMLLPILDRKPELLPESLAIALLDVGDRSDRGDFLDMLAKGRSLPPELAPRNLNPRALREWIAKNLHDPYHRARANLRVLPFFRDQRETLIDAIHDDVRRIPKARLREQVLERLLAASGNPRRRLVSSLLRRWFGPRDRRRRDGLAAEAFSAAIAIPDPNDRARALARLASFFPVAEAGAWLAKAAAIALRGIPNDLELAETLRLLMPHLAAFPNVKRTIRTSKRVQRGIPQLREAAWDLLGPPIERALPWLFHGDPPNAAGWAAVAAAARLRDVLPADDATCDPDILWERLLSPEAPHAFAALKTRGEVEGLPLTRSAAHVLDRARTSARADFEQLLRHLHSPEPETIPILLDWLNGPWPALARQAAIILAERFGLATDTVAGVLAALSDANDLVRLRAMRVVQHPSIVPELGPTRPVSVLGSQPVQTLAREILAIPESTPGRPAMRLYLGNMGSDLILDSPEILREWIETIRRDPGAHRPVDGRLPLEPDPARPGIVAENLIRVSEAVAPPVWETLLEALESGPVPVRAAVLTLLTRMVHRGLNRPNLMKSYGLAPEPWKRVVEILDELLRQPGALPDVRLYLDGIEGLLDVAEGADHEAADAREDRLARVQSLFHRRIRTLAELLENPPPARPLRIPEPDLATWRGSPDPQGRSRSLDLLSLLHDLGGRLLYASGDCREYLRPSDTTETRFKNRPASLEILGDWLRQALARGGPRLGLGELESRLLLAVAQGASVLPDQLPARNDAEEWRRLLVEAARSNPDRTGRCAALVLLGRLLVADETIIPALGSALLDAEDVRQGAFLAITLFRRHTPGFLRALVGKPESRDGLYHESAVCAFGFATLLETLGRGDRTKPEDRQFILDALVAAIKHPSTERVVPLEQPEPGLPELPKLDQLLYRMLLRVAGIEPPSLRRTRTAP